MAYSCFEFVSTMFDRRRYAHLTDKDKNDHYFMAMRTLSTLFPVEIENYNIKGINQVAVLDYWHFRLSQKYKAQPKELFPTTKKATTAKSKVAKFKKEIVKTFLRVNRMDERDFDFLVSIDEAYVIIQLKDIEKDMKESKEYFSSF